MKFHAHTGKRFVAGESDKASIARGKKLWTRVEKELTAEIHTVELTNQESLDLWAYNDFLHRSAGGNPKHKHHGTTPESTFGVKFKVVEPPAPCPTCGKVSTGNPQDKCKDIFHGVRA